MHTLLLCWSPVCCLLSRWIISKRDAIFLLINQQQAGIVRYLCDSLACTICTTWRKYTVFEAYSYSWKYTVFQAYSYSWQYRPTHILESIRYFRPTHILESVEYFRPTHILDGVDLLIFLKVYDISGLLILESRQYFRPAYILEIRWSSVE
jgi:hypothetical protein